MTVNRFSQVEGTGAYFRGTIFSIAYAYIFTGTKFESEYLQIVFKKYIL